MQWKLKILLRSSGLLHHPHRLPCHPISTHILLCCACRHASLNASFMCAACDIPGIRALVCRRRTTLLWVLYVDIAYHKLSIIHFGLHLFVPYNTIVFVLVVCVCVRARSFSFSFFYAPPAAVYMLFMPNASERRSEHMHGVSVCRAMWRTRCFYHFTLYCGRISIMLGCEKFFAAHLVHFRTETQCR